MTQMPPPPETEADRPFPPVVYVPTSGDETGRTRLAMHRIEDGRMALFAYSAMDRLVDGYGDVSWALLGIPDLERAYEQVPYDVLYLDKQMVRVADGDPR